MGGLSSPARIAVASITDERSKVQPRIAPLLRAQQDTVVEVLRAMPRVEVVTEAEPIASPERARAAGRRFAAEGCHATVLSVPTFGFPRLGILLALFAPGPYLLVARPDASQPSPAGILGIGGAMQQLGIAHERLWADPRSPAAAAAMATFAAAASARSLLRGEVLGLVGGRSMGLYPMASSGLEIVKSFGVDVDHVDQVELVRLAAEVPEDTVVRARQWFAAHLAPPPAGVRAPDEEKFREQIRYAAALKRLAAEHGFDSVALKCHYEMSEYRVPQCVSIMTANDPYDWDGPREPLACACEADEDGVLTMRMLSLLSRGPSCLLDLRHYDPVDRCYLLQNCGAAPSWFAGHSSDPRENLRRVSLCPCVPKFAGGGAHFRFTFREGTYTVARLHQSPGGYRMLVARAEAIAPGPAGARLGEDAWPRAHFRIDVPPERLVGRLPCVHLHAVAGDWGDALEQFCRFAGIGVERLVPGSLQTERSPAP